MDRVPQPEYHYLAHNDPLADEHGYRMGKSDLWDTSAIKKSDKEHWISILKEETYEGGSFQYLQQAPIFEVDFDEFLAVITIGEDSYKIPRDSILTQFFGLSPLEKRIAGDPYALTFNKFPHVYVWFRDNGIVGQLPPPRRAPEGRPYITTPLLGTNLWKRAQVTGLLNDDGARWLVLSLSDTLTNFWFRYGVDGTLLKDTDKAAIACTLQNSRILHAIIHEIGWHVALAPPVVPVKPSVWADWGGVDNPYTMWGSSLNTPVLEISPGPKTRTLRPGMADRGAPDPFIHAGVDLAAPKFAKYGSLKWRIQNAGHLKRQKQLRAVWLKDQMLQGHLMPSFAEGGIHTFADLDAMKRSVEDIGSDWDSPADLATHGGLIQRGNRYDVFDIRDPYLTFLANREANSPYWWEDINGRWMVQGPAESGPIYVPEYVDPTPAPPVVSVQVEPEPVSPATVEPEPVSPVTVEPATVEPVERPTPEAGYKYPDQLIVGTDYILFEMVADAGPVWMPVLRKQKGGSPGYEMEQFAGQTRVEVTDIGVGLVWLPDNVAVEFKDTFFDTVRAGDYITENANDPTPQVFHVPTVTENPRAVTIRSSTNFTWVQSTFHEKPGKWRRSTQAEIDTYKEELATWMADHDHAGGVRSPSQEGHLLERNIHYAARLPGG